MAKSVLYRGWLLFFNMQLEGRALRYNVCDYSEMQRLETQGWVENSATCHTIIVDNAQKGRNMKPR